MKMTADLEPLADLSLGSLEDQNQVRFQFFQFGRDYVLFIGGGEDHVGAVACTDKARHEDIWSHGLIHHKEDIVADQAIEKIKQSLTSELLVVAGIHYDDIHPESIKQIVSHCSTLTDQLLELIEKGFDNK